MHNPVGPWKEANALYIEPSRLQKRLLEAENELVLFDVGLGAAANSIAALHCARNTFSRNPDLKGKKFCIVSFEKDLSLLEFALKHRDQFQHFTGFESALKQILERGFWQEGELQWQLRPGDFLENIKKENLRPDFIFYDPYSPKVNQEMWTTFCFQQLYDKCKSAEEGGTLLLTYSQATKIRSALILAGFFVGLGPATGLKEQTTMAATKKSLLDSPLDQRWFLRWQRSNSRYPFDCEESVRSEVDKKIQNYFLECFEK